MRPEPVKRYRPPRYPTIEDVRLDPAIVERNLPEGWRVRRELAGAVGLFLAAGLAACGNGKPATEITPETPKEKAVALVAPIFVHGEGRGATGCVVRNPPVFLSEEEALVLILEELEKQGIHATDRDVELPEVRIAQREKKYGSETDPKTGQKTWTEETIEVPDSATPIVVDAVDPRLGIRLEFVSRSDYYSLGGVYMNATGHDWKLREVATGLATKLASDAPADATYGVFYDPCVSKGFNNKDPKESREALREQVRDFVDWLKAQGAI